MHLGQAKGRRRHTPSLEDPLNSKTRTNREIRLKAMLVAERKRSADLADENRKLRREVIVLRSRQVGATHEQLVLLDELQK